MAIHAGHAETSESLARLEVDTLEGHALAEHRAQQNGMSVSLYPDWSVSDGVIGPVSGDDLAIARGGFWQGK